MKELQNIKSFDEFILEKNSSKKEEVIDEVVEATKEEISEESTTE